MVPTKVVSRAERKMLEGKIAIVESGGALPATNFHRG